MIQQSFQHGILIGFSDAKSVEFWEQFDVE